MANMRVMMTNERRALVVSITAGGSGDSREKTFPTAASQAMVARETRSRNPMPTTIVNDQKRSLITPMTPRPGLVVTPQIVFSASCSSPKTPHSPNRSVMTPSPVATRLARACGRSVAACTAWPPGPDEI
jgi:hypothetical protein